MWSIPLLLVANIFMTFAWYGHLKSLQDKPLYLVVLISWGIAFFEYCLQVPANRIGIGVFDLGQLKVIQEILTMVVFVAFAHFYMGRPFTMNWVYAGICLVAAAYFIFRDGVGATTHG